MVFRDLRRPLSDKIVGLLARSAVVFLISHPHRHIAFVGGHYETFAESAARDDVRLVLSNESRIDLLF